MSGTCETSEREMMPLDVSDLDRLLVSVGTLPPLSVVRVEAYDLRQLALIAAGESEQMHTLQNKLDDEQAALGEVRKLVAKFKLGNQTLIEGNEELKELLDQILAECGE